ncbi:MAG TPA: GNAT family N-acetyltransferase [Allosphingosinicella sp.]|jgi:ribosomal protein S18 acetylase RimI-like enzyme
MTVSYRNARPDDAAVLADLHRRAFVETFGHLYGRRDLDAFLAQLTEEGFRDELADARYEVRFAEAEGAPVGFAKLGPIGLPVDPVRPALELKQLYLLKPWQGRGIADALTAWLLERARARGAEELYLSVWSQNGRARRFYERYGFVFFAPYAFMVGDQADEDEIMRLSLEPAQ